jgi:MOSC domain-containing protein YiiM
MISLGPHDFTETDAQRTLSHLGALWDLMMQGRSSATADALGTSLAGRLTELLGSAPDTALADLGAAAATFRESSPVLRSALDDVWSTLEAASAALRSDGQLPTTAHGAVSQLSASKGGVPKLPLGSVEVSFTGVVGDLQRSRQHHGRPWQALCLYADEVIDAFRADGHPITRGSAGENITVRGFNWADVRPGVRLRVGTVVADVQAYAIPCRHNAQWFSDGDFNRMSSQRGPVSRVYATVREPGHINTGDEVILEP